MNKDISHYWTGRLSEMLTFISKQQIRAYYVLNEYEWKKYVFGFWSINKI